MIHWKWLVKARLLSFFLLFSGYINQAQNSIEYELKGGWRKRPNTVDKAPVQRAQGQAHK